MSGSYVGYDYTGFLIFVKILGSCSMVASSFIMRDVLHKLRRSSASGTERSWRQRISLTQSVLFCLSLGDFFSAFFVQFLSTWMVPSNIEVSMASGNVNTCTVQGIFGYIFYGLSASSNASLAVVYCLITKFGWRDGDKERHRLPFTLIPIIYALTFAIIPLFGKHYNYNGGFFCDITASPLGCDYPGSTTQCTRGNNSRYMLLYVGVIPFVIAFAIIIAAVVLLVHSVLKRERRMDRYRRESGMSLDRRMTAQTARQGLYYIGAFGLAWIPWYIYAIVEFHQGRITKALGIIHYTTMPLQGVFNALLYFRPKYKSDRSRNPTQSRVSSVERVLRISFPAVYCCCKAKKSEPKPNETSDGATAHHASLGEVNGHVEQKKHKELVKEEKNEEPNAMMSKEIDSEKQSTSVKFSDAV